MNNHNRNELIKVSVHMKNYFKVIPINNNLNYNIRKYKNKR